MASARFLRDDGHHPPASGAGKPGQARAVGGIFRSGPAWHLPISTEVDAQLRWLQGIDPDILLTYPANLDTLLTEIRRGHLALPRLREVRTISSTVMPALRERCQSVLNVPLTGLYSARRWASSPCNAL